MRWMVAGLIVLMAMVAVPVVAAEPSDGEIRDELMIKLAGDRDVRGTAIEVTVEEGVVTLEGTVTDDKAKKRAEKLSKKQKGVKKVVNKIEVTHL